MRPELGTYGVFANTRQLDPAIAAELESLGYGTLWVGGSPSGDLEVIDRLLEATSSLVLATGIVNIWKDDAATVAASFHRIEARFPGRFLLGIGVGHPEQNGEQYQQPYDALVRYLDGLDANDVPAEQRVLAALGPRVLRLAAARTAGAHPYLTTPAHTQLARAILGPGVLLAPEHKVALVADPEIGRSLGRSRVEKPYLGLSNYVSNLRRLGYSTADLDGAGSDRLIDDLVAHGDAASIAAALSLHLGAGADHVAIQAIALQGDDGILPTLRELASVLF